MFLVCHLNMELRILICSVLVCYSGKKNTFFILTCSFSSFILFDLLSSLKNNSSTNWTVPGVRNKKNISVVILKVNINRSQLHVQIIKFEELIRPKWTKKSNLKKPITCTFMPFRLTVHQQSCRSSSKNHINGTNYTAPYAQTVILVLPRPKMFKFNKEYKRCFALSKSRKYYRKCGKRQNKFGNETNQTTQLGKGTSTC